MKTTHSGKANLLFLFLCSNSVGAGTKNAIDTELSVYNMSSAQQLHNSENCYSLLCGEMEERGVDTSTFSQCFDQDGAAQIHGGTEHDSIWYMWGTSIFLITVGGFGFTRWGVVKDDDDGLIFVSPGMARVLLSNAPLVVCWSGYVSCERGLPWRVHLIHTFSCVLATPPLSGLGFSGIKTIVLFAF